MNHVNFQVVQYILICFNNLLQQRFSSTKFNLYQLIDLSLSKCWMYTLIKRKLRNFKTILFDILVSWSSVKKQEKLFCKTFPSFYLLNLITSTRHVIPTPQVRMPFGRIFFLYKEIKKRKLAVVSCRIVPKVRNGDPAPLLRHPSFDPAFLLFLRYLFALPFFLFQPLSKVFQIVPPHLP